VWPWEHVAVGYLVLSVLARGWTDEPPTGVSTLWLVVGSVFPDLVDKPLAWSLGVLPSGTSVAHSVFVAVPVVAVTLLLARRAGHTAAAVGFGVGYLVHLPADAVYPAVVGGSVAPGVFLWPLVEGDAGPPVGLLSETGRLLAVLGNNLTDTAGLLYAVAALLVVGGAVLLWWVDGAPGVGRLRSAARRRS
jgi:hypothetical protein